MPKPKFLLDTDSARLINKTEYHIRPGKFKRQGGGAATQLPAEQYHSGSNPDLGFELILKPQLTTFFFVTYDFARAHLTTTTKAQRAQRIHKE
jgi:hypothetical protein